MPEAQPIPSRPTDAALRSDRPARRSVIDVGRIERMLEGVAFLVIGDPINLPIFERLERELATARSAEAAIERARALAAKAKARK